MSSSNDFMWAALPPLLTEFERLLILWGDHSNECDQKRLVHLNVSMGFTQLNEILAKRSQQRAVCKALNEVDSKPPEYLQYLQKVLKIIKMPVRQSQPIPWPEIVALKSLSDLNLTSHNVKTKYVEIDEIGVKQEEVEMDMVRLMQSFFPQ